MARVNAADASLCLDATPPTEPRASHDGVAPKSLLTRLRSASRAHAQATPLARAVTPALVALLLLTLLAVAVQTALQIRDRVAPEALTRLDLFARVAAEDFDASVRRAPPGAPASLILDSALTRPLMSGEIVAVTDADGKIVATSPVAPALAGSPQGYLADWIGPAQPVVIFADKAGAMRLTLSDGTEALAAVRNLSAPYGQIAVVRPLDAALADWRAIAWRAAALFGIAAAALILGAVAFFGEARRALASEIERDAISARIDAALNRGRCGLWDWDLARGRVFWSDSMYDMLSLRRASQYMSFGDLRALIHPDDDRLVELAEQLCAGTIHAIDHAFRIRNAEGEWVWIRARAETVAGAGESGARLIGIAVDISEQVRLAEMSAAADLRLRDAVETISEAFALWDAENRLVLCNSKFQRVHALPAEAVAPGAPYAQVMAFSRNYAEFAQPLSGAGAGRVYEARLADGRWLQINERRTKDGGYVSVGADISALKRHEQQLLDSERRLMATVADLRKSRQTLEHQAQQLAELAERYLEQKAMAETASRAKSDFLANMSHELRTPLTHIIGFAEVMEGQFFGEIGNERYVQYATHIRQSGQYLHGVISDVLEMSRLDAGQVTLEIRDIDLADTLGEAVEAEREAAQAKDVALTLAAPPAERVSADPELLRRVIGILLKNAIKFTPEGGAVAVRAERVGAAYDIFVQDNGCGMSAEDIASALKPFEQTSSLMQDGMKGAGLGLAIAASLVELHGGGLSIDSTPDQGSTICIHLPGPSEQARNRIALSSAS